MYYRLGPARWLSLGVIGLVGTVAGVGFGHHPSLAAQDQSPVQTFTVHAHKYSFEPARLEVQQDDLVKVTFRADDIPHSFTVDAYRISKRAAGGQTVTFEFRADNAGTFPFYCDLRADEGCRQMRGELVVRRR
jgi:heme/copper-type cytochrome/quinol oxidase subunit 2